MPDYGDISHLTKQYCSYTSGGTTAILSYYDASRGTRGPRSWRRWYVCHLCGVEFPENEVMLAGGVPYGIPCGDYLDYKTRPRE